MDEKYASKKQFPLTHADCDSFVVIHFMDGIRNSVPTQRRCSRGPQIVRVCVRYTLIQTQSLRSILAFASKGSKNAEIASRN